MFFGIISAVFAAALLYGVFAFVERRGIKKIERSIGGSLSDKDFIDSVTAFAYEIKNYSRIKKCRRIKNSRVGFHPIRGGVIHKAYKIVAKKIADGRRIYEFEKWIYDNYYIIDNFGGFKTLKKLPSKDGKPVALALAERIIGASFDSLKPERIKKGIEAYAKINRLTVDEVLLLKQSFCYAVFERLCKIAERVILLNKAYRAAQRPSLSPRFLNCNSYLYYLLDKRAKDGGKTKAPHYYAPLTEGNMRAEDGGETKTGNARIQNDRRRARAEDGGEIKTRIKKKDRGYGGVGSRAKRGETDAYLEKNDFDYGRINYVFAAVIAESNAHTAALITYLLEKNLFERESVLAFSGLHQRLTKEDTIYKNSDTATKIAYLKRVAELSEKVGVEQSEFFDVLRAAAEKYGKYYGELIFYYQNDLIKALKKDRGISEKLRDERQDIEKASMENGGDLKKLRDGSERKCRAYSFSVFFAAALLTAATAFWINSVAVYILSPLIFIVFLRTSFCVINSFLSRAVKDKTVFGYDFQEVADENATMTVVSQFIASKEQLKEAILKAETLAAANGGKNIEFALLIDLFSSENKTDERDAEILEVIERYSGELSFFIRERSKAFGRYSGRERKRGAVEALSKYIHDENEGKNGDLSRECNKAEGGENGGVILSKHIQNEKRGENREYNKADDGKGDCIIPSEYIQNEGKTDKGEKDGEFRLVKRKKKFSKNNVKYFVFLDADNELLPDSVIGLVNRIIHPLNSRRDMLTLSARYNAFSIENAYQRRFKDLSGVESYPYYSGLFDKLFGREVFSGKGIVRAEELYKKLYGRLPNNRVLSHDIIEGAILDTASSGIVTFEDAPKDFYSDVARYARWSKGDVLLLTFLKNKVKNAAGGTERLKISSLYKTVIAVNAGGVLYPLCLLAVALAGLSIPELFFVVLTASFLNTAVNSVFKIFSDARFFYKARDIASAFARDFCGVLMSPFFALRGVFIYIFTAYRLLFDEEKVLEWRTFYETQRGKGERGAALQYLFPSFVMMFGFAVLDFFAFSRVAAALIAVCYAAAYFVYIRAGNKKTDADIEANEGFLIGYAEKTYRFFEDNLKGNPLVCDNFQSEPYLGASRSTSPTNIGFSMLAEVSKYYIGMYKRSRGGLKNSAEEYKNALLNGAFFDEAALEKAAVQISKIAAAALKLEKWRGHLYNWYDIDDGKILPPAFISSVDSANFTAALIVVREFLDIHIGAPDISDGLKGRMRGVYEGICRLIDGADFSKLYDYKRNLFYIGYDASSEKYAAHYDLLASESRILSYIGSVSSLPCWFKLSRKVAKYRGNTLYSWSGTMFEYLMADIFLKAPRGSLLFNSSENAAKIQKKTRCNGVFGLSESGYYGFDDGMKYQYQAFGVNVLSLKSRSNECVISPYASFLALKYLGGGAVKNLLRLKSLCMTGEYGYFEAMDFSKKKPVASYMAHHQGMIMCSIANYLNDDIFCSLFMRDKKIASGRHLLSENNIETAPSKSAKKNDFIRAAIPSRRGYFCLSPRDLPCYAILSNRRYTLVADDSGRASSVFENLRVTREAESIEDVSGKFLYIRDSETGEVFCPTYAPFFDRREDYTAEFFKDRCVYTNKKKRCVHTTRVPVGLNGEIHTFSIESDGEGGEFDLSFFGGDIVLGHDDAYMSHKAFYNMFIDVRKGGENYYVAERKKTRGSDGNYYAAMLVKGVDIQPEFNRYNFIGRGRSLKNPVITERKGDEKRALNIDISECENEADNKSLNAVSKCESSARNEADIYISECEKRACNKPLNIVSEFEKSEKNARNSECGKSFESIGGVIEPCFGFTAKIRLKKGEKKEFSVIITAAKNLDELGAGIRRANTFVFDRLIDDVDFIGHSGALNEDENLMLTEILPRIIDFPVRQESLKAVLNSSLYGIYKNYSGGFEYKILYYRHASDRDEDYFISVLKVFDRMRNAGIKVKLLVSEPRFDPYHDPVKKLIKRYVGDFASVAVLDEGKDAEDFLAAVCFLNFNDYKRNGLREIEFGERKILREHRDAQFKKHESGENDGENTEIGDADDNGEKNQNIQTAISAENAEKRLIWGRGNRAFDSGAGYFTVGGGFVVEGLNPPLPYSNVVAMENGGFVVTENGGGFSFFLNSRENKVSVHNLDPVTDAPSERLFLSDGREIFRINRGAGFTEHLNGMTTFYSEIDCGETAVDAHVSEYPGKDGNVKIFEARIRNRAKKAANFTLFLDIDPALSSRQNKNALVYEYKEDSATVTNAANGQAAVLKVYGGMTIKNKSDLVDRTGYIYSEYTAEGEKNDGTDGFLYQNFAAKPQNHAQNEKENDGFTKFSYKNFNAKSRNSVNNARGDDGFNEFSHRAFAAKYEFSLQADKTKKFFFVLSGGEKYLVGYEPEEIQEDKLRALKYFSDFDKVKIYTGDKYLDMMFNRRLTYQVVSSRFNGRCGYYQAGGAIGFRDQLQDALALVHSRPDMLRRHILLCAARQYEEGDVMHWWHAERLGVRTKISDDKLFLPYCTFKYIDATGDLSILNEEIPYLVSPPLLGYEHSRLETPNVSDRREPLSRHIERAIESALQYGAHDLLLIGGGDWNDALDAVGTKGKGESVWLSMFAYEVLKMYKAASTENRLKYVADELRLKKAVNESGFDGAWFRRAYTDDGEILGGRFSKNCRIDLICQSYAAISGIADGDKAEKALNAAAALVDRENRIVKLFAPPFDGEKFYGYISSYPVGVRENGGQYTHAVMWYISALFKSGRADEAYELLKMINPAEIMSGRDDERSSNGLKDMELRDTESVRGLKELNDKENTESARLKELNDNENTESARSKIVGEVQKNSAYKKMSGNFENAERTEDERRKNSEKYLGEPYVVGADVSLKGKMGWNWYTGSAGLMYRVILEDMLGITLVNNRIKIKPNLPSSMNFCKVEYRYKKCVYNIEIKRREGKKTFLINGTDIGNNYGIALKEEGKYDIEVYI
jgi:cellobiose phosphorylase